MIIKNAKIYGTYLQDIEIEEGKIKAIASNLQGKQILDAKGMSVLPSFVDLCVNLKNDKFSLAHLDLIEEECLKGGISAIILRDCMDFDEESFALFLQNLIRRKVQIFSSIRVKNKSGKLKNLATLLNKGACALELDSALDANTLKIASQYAFMKNAPLLVRCYDEDFDDNGVMNDCEISFNLGLIGMSKIAETSQVAKMKELAKFYKNKAVFDLLSLQDSLDLLHEKDLKLVSIHHLIKNDMACEGFNTAAKLMPPLRSKEDSYALKKALKDGKIHFLTSLHSAKSLSLKELAFDEAAFGIHSICDFVSLCYTFLIKDNFLSWQELCQFTSKNPSEFLGLNSGIIEEGKEANLIFFDENEELELPKNSLYAEDKLFGKVKMHMIKGKNVLDS
ncbi:metal-dependent hydrolase [Campylobacter sp. VicNov18]|uniref:metal-dependent hydrolase n=1 Tax=Campylobacter bilis TaxID=2691918 RepID=UPI00130E76E6|nr:metal-dependent hydrolase [Campylobacter bilis]MPV63179.1 metal-dependent hydrolase [Campylobacter hepaticus]MBM0636679.1 metal-dependent hydrolase [Campylobacter bilis]MCC8277523.1 metal-dependent hydrolase [Campylobacter bilis]MCC8298728.1 metal-dependent hydrolase [Campylobacter bilis]MCC8300432.1 metal-dependent hydrolase [Campylobacter bilis]